VAASSWPGRATAGGEPGATAPRRAACGTVHARAGWRSGVHQGATPGIQGADFPGSSAPSSREKNFCVTCGEEFETTWGQFCSKRCALEHAEPHARGECEVPWFLYSNSPNGFECVRSALAACTGLRVSSSARSWTLRSSACEAAEAASCE
jgi:hypothetical protein